MEPESDPRPAYTKEQKYVTIPVEMAHVLFDCYYGGAPRLSEKREGGGVQSRVPPPAQEAFDVNYAGPPGLQETTIPRFPKEWVPKGYAARRSGSIAEETDVSGIDATAE